MPPYDDEVEATDVPGLVVGRPVYYVAYNSQPLFGFVIGINEVDSTADLVIMTSMTNVAGQKNFGLQFHQNVKFSGENHPGTFHYPPFFQ